MPFKLSKLVGDSEFEELVRCLFDAYEKPETQGLLQLFFPIKSSSPTAREDAIADAAKRLSLWHRSDRSSTWILVKDERSGKLVGAAFWHLYETDPYAVIPEEECDWWSAGTDRLVANTMMEQFLTPRMTYMRKPHVFLDICFTHPDYQRQGVGRMLVDWGVKLADEKNLASYIDATDDGAALYSQYGFLKGVKKEVILANLEQTPRLKELEKELLPTEWWPIYRPAGGKYEEGKTVLPWEGNEK